MGFVKGFSGEMVEFSCRKHARLIRRMDKIVLFVLIDLKKQDDIALFSDLYMLVVGIRAYFSFYSWWSFLEKYYLPVPPRPWLNTQTHKVLVMRIFVLTLAMEDSYNILKLRMLLGSSIAYHKL